MFQNRQFFKFPAALRYHHSQYLPAGTLKIRRLIQTLQRIVAAALFVFLDVLIRIHNINELSQIKAHFREHRLPFVLPIHQYFRHNAAKGSCHFIQIGSMFCLPFGKLLHCVRNPLCLFLIKAQNLTVFSGKHSKHTFC